MDRRLPPHARRTLRALWQAVDQSEHGHRQGIPEDHARRVVAATLADEDETISDEEIDHHLTFLQNHGEIYSVNDWVRITDPDDVAPDLTENGTNDEKEDTG